MNEMSFRSIVAVLPFNNIDTDQIIPARYLKATDKASVAEGLFADYRRLPDGSLDPGFPLNDPAYSGAQVILAGDNFGCGSSREHAPWALTGSGIRCVISMSFADIFRNNALKNGLLPVVVPADIHAGMVKYFQDHPDAEVSVNLEEQEVSLPNGVSFTFEIDPFSKKCLLAGEDQLEYILSHVDQIEAYERSFEK
jgi:3-isopropylmalate/(R)-2-methylmalate dehydratase small subunit